MLKSFWSKAAKWACHVLNRCFTSALQDKVPEECWSGRKPSIDYFRVFGCIGHVQIPKQLRTKLDDRSHKCILLGVSTGSKAYRLYDPIQRKIIISRDVIFEEEKKWDWKTEESGSNTLDWEEKEDVPVEEEPTEEEEMAEPCPTNMAAPLTPRNARETVGDESPRRTRSAPVWMSDYQSGEGFSEEEEVEYVMFNSLDDPTTFEEASKEQKWVTAMESEMQAIKRNKTWDLVVRPPGVETIGVKWVFKTKLREDGQVDKFKARLVVKGYAQKKGVTTRCLHQWLDETQYERYWL